MTSTRDQPITEDATIIRFLEGTRDIRAAGARFVLFGSRARHDGRPDSDYDILVVLPRKDREIKSRLYDAVVDALSETGRLISLKVFDRATYDRLCAIPTPFMVNVMREGIALG